MKNSLTLVEDTKWLEGTLAFKSLRYHQDGHPYGYFQLKIHGDKKHPIDCDGWLPSPQASSWWSCQLFGYTLRQLFWRRRKVPWMIFQVMKMIGKNGREVSMDLPMFWWNDMMQNKCHLLVCTKKTARPDSLSLSSMHTIEGSSFLPECSHSSSGQSVISALRAWTSLLLNSTPICWTQDRQIRLLR